MSMTIGKKARELLVKMALRQARMGEHGSSTLLHRILERCTDADESEREPAAWMVRNAFNGVVGGVWDRLKDAEAYIIEEKKHSSNVLSIVPLYERASND